jgi:tetratricopeptide (TPR) repeat protein
LEESARLEDRTRRFLLAAGDAAFNVDLATAQEWYERALAFTPAGHPSQPAVVSRLAHAAYRTGGLADSAELFERAIQGFRAERNILGQGDTMVRFSVCLWTKGESARSQAMLREAVALLEGETPGPELVRGYAALAFQKAVTEPSEEAIAWADKTSALAERFGLAEERVAGLVYRGLSRCFLGDSGGVEDLRAAVALAKASGLASVVSVMFNLAFVLWPREGPAVALACYREGLDTALGRGFRNEEMAMRAATVGPLYELGRWSEALSIGRDVVTWLEEHGADYDRAEVEHRMAQVLFHRGDVSAAEGIVERCLAVARETEDPELTASSLVTSAMVAQRRRDSRRALRLARAADAAGRAQPGSHRTGLLPDLIRIVVAAKDLRLARRLLESPELKTIRDEHAFVTARAVLAEGEAEFRDAASLYREAAERWAAFGLLFEQGMGRLGEGRCLAAVDAPGASSAMRRARRIFQRLGARVV